jgi:hypothetical protein
MNKEMELIYLIVLSQYFIRIDDSHHYHVSQTGTKSLPVGNLRLVVDYTANWIDFSGQHIL